MLDTIYCRLTSNLIQRIEVSQKAGSATKLVNMAIKAMPADLIQVEMVAEFIASQLRTASSNV